MGREGEILTQVTLAVGTPLVIVRRQFGDVQSPTHLAKDVVELALLRVRQRTMERLEGTLGLIDQQVQYVPMRPVRDALTAPLLHSLVCGANGGERALRLV